MEVSRRGFIGGSAALVGAAAVAGQTAVAGRPPYREGRSLLRPQGEGRAPARPGVVPPAADYAALRKELRAFYPDECHGKCKDPAFDESDRAIRADLRAYAAAHPDYDALDIRRESYRAMRKHFRPFLFSESPFYFEAGVNGGWVMGIMPAREVNNLCRRAR